jgi:hypothetical protein
MRRAVAAFLLLISPPLVFGQAATQFAKGTVKGSGYEIALPADVVANVSPSQETSHGFAIDLLRAGDEHDWDRTPLRYIAFNTRWDAGDLPSLNAVVDSMTIELNQLMPIDVQGPGQVRLISTFPAKLGDLPAKRLVLEFTNSEKKPAIKQIVVAYRTRHDAAGMIYVASLTTTRLNFQQDVTLFAKILAGFKLTSE